MTVKQRLAIVAGGVAFPFLWLAVLSALDSPPRIDDAWAVREATYLASHADTPPPRSADWQATRVPGNGPVPFAQDGFHSVWYQLPPATLPVDPSTVWGLFLDAPDGNVAVFVDGQEVFATGSFTSPLTYVRTPVLVPLPTVSGAQALHIRIGRTSAWAGIGGVYAAPLADLTPAWQWAQRLHVTVPRTIAIVMLALIVLLALLWRLNPREAAYGWLALTLVIWAGHTLSMTARELPVDHWLWMGWTYGLNAWVLTVVVAFDRIYGFGSRFVRIGMRALGAPLTVCAFVLPLFVGTDTLYMFYLAIWQPFLLFWAFFTLWQHSRAIRRRADFESVGLLLHGCAAFVIGVRDVLFDTGAVDVGGSVAYLQYFAPVSMLFFVVILARRFIAFQRAAEAANESLEAEVQKKTSELDTYYQRLIDLEKTAASAQERARITRDMHDGLGGHLVHLLALTEDGSSAAALRSPVSAALADLRTIIDSTSPGANDLTTVLATFRHRNAGLADAAGLTVHWHVEDLGERPLSAEQALHLTRFLQEAATNVVRHAQASSITLSAKRIGSGVQITIRDDGRGFDAAHAAQRTSGGLAHLQERAAQLQGTLQIDSGERGTELTLHLPD